MRSGRRLCALVVIVALVAAIPFGVPGGCPDCPADCPMHQPRPHAGASGAPRLGCHRGTPPPAGTVCLRSACGRHVATEAASLPALLPAPIRVAAAHVVARFVSGDPTAASPPNADPPTEPPRAVAV
jgi:hypothetical protein